MLKTLSLAGLLALGTASLALADDPQRGGMMVFTAPYGSSFATLDGQASPMIMDQFLSTAIHRSLYEWDSLNNTPQLELADSVDISEDGLVYTFHLRQNAVFHNDKPLTADDIIFSYERIASPTNALPGARYIQVIKGAAAYSAGQAEHIEGLKKIDDHTLEMTLTAASNPGFGLMQPGTAIFPSNVDPAEQVVKPVGLGPFVFREHIPGAEVTFDRFDKYFKEGQPYLDRLKIVPMGDGAARDVAFRNREIDNNVLGPAQYQEYQADPALAEHLLEVAEVFTRGLNFNLEEDVFKDVRVRQAINHAINSDLIIERLIKGKAFRATGWLPVSSPAYNPDAVPYEYDVEKAKALLAEAGHADGISFEATSQPNESWGTTIVEAVIPMLAEAGINLTVKQIEAAAMGETMTSGNFQSLMMSLQTGPDPLEAMRCYYSKTPVSACNYTRFNNADYDKLFEAAEAEPDTDKRNAILREANDLVQAEAPLWFFNYNKAVMAYQPWVHGLVPNATELALQPYDRIWIDDSAPADRK